MKDNKIDKARALYYAMFSKFFVFSTNNERYLELVNLINTLKQSPLDNTTAQAFENLSQALKTDTNVPFMLEFDDIFHSPESTTVRTTASYYDEDIESGKKRLEMQNFLAKTKIRRDEKKYPDYEDHIGFIFAVMSELCTLISEDNKEYKNTAHCIFSQILNEFVDDFSREIYEHEISKIFKDVIVLLKAFIEFERIYLEVSIPAPTQRVHRREIKEELSDIEVERRARNKALRVKGPKKEQEKVFTTLDVEDDM
jgi:TorA maturation chaperone TorD